VSAAFLATNRQAILLGVTHQLTGLAPHPTLAFQYCGSLAPVALSEACRHSIARIGQSLVSATGLCGVFGIDLIVESETPWLVEVNPRFTASMELFEYPDRLSVMGRHMRSFPDSSGSPSPQFAAERDGVCEVPARQYGATSDQATSHACALKVIAYLVGGGRVSRTLHGQLVARGHDVADIPMPGVHLRAGDPLCTVLVRGRDFPDLITQGVGLWNWLKRQAGDLTWTAVRLQRALEAAHARAQLGTNTS
jgi:predicted ATP-grasp superfamily ATP-dependent carboligase